MIDTIITRREEDTTTEKINDDGQRSTTTLAAALCPFGILDQCKEAYTEWRSILRNIMRHQSKNI